MEFLDWLTVLTFFMAASTWVYKWYEGRIDFELRVIDYIPMPYNAHVFYISLENRSNKPISISRVVLFDRKSQIYIEQHPKPELVYELVANRAGGNVQLEEYRTMQLPLSLPGLGAVSGYVQFNDTQNQLINLSEQANFQIHTNRDKTLEFSLKPEYTLTTDQLINR